jgi:hypothetical protein
VEDLNWGCEILATLNGSDELPPRTAETLFELLMNCRPEQPKGCSNS